MSNLASSYKECTVQLPYSEYAEINKGLMKFIMQAVLKGETVELPMRMGDITIAGTKVIPKFNEEGEISNLAPDWVGTKKLWDRNPKAKEEKQLLYHFNEHTAGVRYKICWNKGMTGALNKILYTFIASRENKRAVWKSVLAGVEFYVKPRYYGNKER